MTGPFQLPPTSHPSDQTWSPGSARGPASCRGGLLELRAQSKTFPNTPELQAAAESPSGQFVLAAGEGHEGQTRRGRNPQYLSSDLESCSRPLG